MLNVLDQLRKRRRDASRRREASEALVLPELLVFPGELRGTKIHARTLGRVLERIKWQDIVTAHGLRSTLRDWCRHNKFPSVWWEIQVDHRLGDKTSQSYGHDPLTEERRGMMEEWGEHCSKLSPEPKAGKIVKLSDKRRSA